MTDAELFIEIDDVSFSYPGTLHGVAPVLANLSVQICRGEYVAVLGRNGSGKSTLARLLNGLLTPSRGRVVVSGLDTSVAANLRAIRQRIGMIFQYPESQMVATVVEDDIAFGLENMNVPRPEMHVRVNNALRAVGMEEFRRRPPHLLSGGQQQRIAIASVMAMQTDCVVFDEATSMLDVAGRHDVLNQISQLHANGKTIITITHYMEEALRAKRVIVLDGGKVVLDGPPRDVFARIDVLKKCRLDVPVATDLATRFASMGLDFGTVPLTPSEFAKAFHEAKETGQMVRLRQKLSQARPSAADGILQADRNISPVSQRRAAVNADVDDDSAGSADSASSIGSEPILELRHISHIYGAGSPLAHKALEDVSLAIPRGAIVAIVGQTGSGKSTLIQCLNGLLQPVEGTVLLHGAPLTRSQQNLRQLRQTVGMVFQHPEDQLFETLIGDDVAYGPFQYGYPLVEVRRRVEYAMKIVGLDFAWRDKPIRGLSGGEKRKVALAGVIALLPEVLVLDEPTAGLDPASRDELLRNLQTLNRERGTTIIFVTHQMEAVARLASSIFVLKAGRLVAQGHPRQLFANSATLSEYHLGRPETVDLLQCVKDAGIQLDPLRFSGEDAFYTLLWAVCEEGKGFHVGV